MGLYLRTESLFFWRVEAGIMHLLTTGLQRLQEQEDEAEEDSKIPQNSSKTPFPPPLPFPLIHPYV